VALHLFVIAHILIYIIHGFDIRNEVSKSVDDIRKKCNPITKTLV